MIRVLIVDDSAFYRALLRKVLTEMSDVEVVGAASDGLKAMEQIDLARPDVLTLDMNMPNMDGMETLARLAVKHPNLQVIVVSSESANDAERAVQVLDAGAFDFVLKPKSSDPEPMNSLREQLQPRLAAAYARARRLTLSARPAAARPTAATTQTATAPLPQTPQTPATPPSAPAIKRSRPLPPDLVAIGSSTGGPAALHEVLKMLDARLKVPVVVVQHMPKLFIESLAKRLDSTIPIRCKVAEEGERLQAGTVYFAPGERQMEVVRQGGMYQVHLRDAPPEHHCRPAVDFTLRSLAELMPAATAVVAILTGMGADGADGALRLAAKNSWVIAQDKESSVVWGMPGETVRLGAAHQVLPLAQIGVAINRIVMER